MVASGSKNESNRYTYLSIASRPILNPIKTEFDQKDSNSLQLHLVQLVHIPDDQARGCLTSTKTHLNLEKWSEMNFSNFFVK